LGPWDENIKKLGKSQGGERREGEGKLKLQKLILSKRLIAQR
jgi:hypothetical protein